MDFAGGAVKFPVGSGNAGVRHPIPGGAAPLELNAAEGISSPILKRSAFNVSY